ncbi:outer membrane beta-barrel protein [bacterium]|nr:outer membrane beta-barrel protein [candidate division CSSED10-310 bacterium]
MISKKRFGFGVFLAVLSLFALKPNIGNAEEWHRDGSVEMFLMGQMMGGDKTSSLGMTMEVDDCVVGGFGAGICLTDYVNFNGELYIGNTDIIATSGGDRVKLGSKIKGGELNLDVYLLKKRITPMITGGLGYVAFEVDESTGETDFAYNIGAGIRAELRKHLLVKVIYRNTWTELKDTDDPVMLDGISFTIGFFTGPTDNN